MENQKKENGKATAPINPGRVANPSSPAQDLELEALLWSSPIAQSTPNRRFDATATSLRTKKFPSPQKSELDMYAEFFESESTQALIRQRVKERSNLGLRASSALGNSDPNTSHLLHHPHQTSTTSGRVPGPRPRPAKAELPKDVDELQSDESKFDIGLKRI